MRALILLGLLATTSAAAQTADLRVTVTPVPPRIPAGVTVTWIAAIENLGPDTATIVHFASHIGPTECFSVTLPSLAAGERYSRLCNVAAPPWPYRSSVSAGGQAERTPDSDFTNNAASHAYDLDTPPELATFVGLPRAVDPGLPFPIDVQYANLAPTEATGVTITVSAPQATRFVELPANCSAEGSVATCAVGTVGFSPTPWSPYTILSVRAVAPEGSRMPVEVTATIRANEDDLEPANNSHSHATQTYRTFSVTNTSDAGPGSLRDAITESGIACSEDVPCKIAFRIPANGAAWHTIQPLTALPAVHGADISLDGTTQTRYFGDTNPLGPEVEIRGDQLQGAIDGIVVEAGCNLEVFGLTINSFPNAGIRIGDSRCTRNVYLPSAVAHNHIGTDATGMRAMPNNRGIYIDGTDFVAVHHNVISGNHRSGVFVQHGYSTNVYRNIIGLNANVTAGLGNGASGIYFSAGGAASDAFENYIGFNAHAGVALHPDAIQSAVTANSYQANGGLAIDFGHDSVSIEMPDSYAGLPLRIPEITSAVYDPARNETIIEGTAMRYGETVTVYIHANDAPDPSGYGEGQYYLGSTEVVSGGRFRFVWPGRTPGPWIAANIARYTILGLRSPRTEDSGAGAQTTSSEFSRTVQVQ